MEGSRADSSERLNDSIQADIKPIVSQAEHQK